MLETSRGSLEVTDLTNTLRLLVPLVKQIRSEFEKYVSLFCVCRVFVIKICLAQFVLLCSWLFFLVLDCVHCTICTFMQVAVLPCNI